MSRGGGGGSGSGMMSSKEQALMWQQGHYMGGESGFISAATTQPSSQSGHDGDGGSVHGTGSEMGGAGGGGGGCYTGGPGSITGSSLYDLDSAHPSGKDRTNSSKSRLFGFFLPRVKFRKPNIDFFYV